MGRVMTIWTASTAASAVRVPRAAPAAPHTGISSALSVRSTPPPAVTERATFPSCPVGTRICMPRIFVRPMNSTVGMMICMAGTAGRKAGPDSTCTVSRAKSMKNTVRGTAA